MKARCAIAVAAIAALAIAGCGGGSSSSTTSTSALSKSEFLAKGNAICAKGEKQIGTAGKKFFSQSQAPSQATQEKFATQVVIPNIQQQVDGIKALPAPAADEDQVNAIVEAAQSALDKVKQDPSLITQSQGSDPFTQANKLANAYGLTQCGSDNG